MVVLGDKIQGGCVRGAAEVGPVVVVAVAVAVAVVVGVPAVGLVHQERGGRPLDSREVELSGA